jgi:hypothetical protein
MPELAEYQRRFAAALLGRPGVALEPVTQRALQVHRRTVLAGLGNALALSFPTVKKLTGAAYFEALVSEFVSQHPPDSAVLHDYGAELPAFLETFPGAGGYPYFGAVARFDWAVDQTAHCVPGRLRYVRFEYAVDLIRDAVESDRDEELQQLDVRPNPRYLALWRSPEGTSVKVLTAADWQILTGER